MKEEPCNCEQALQLKQLLKEANQTLGKIVCGGMSLSKIMKLQDKINKELEKKTCHKNLSQ